MLRGRGGLNFMRVSGDNDTGGVFCSKNSPQETMFDFRLFKRLF